MSEEVSFINAVCGDFECADRFCLQTNKAKVIAITVRKKWLECFSGLTGSKVTNCVSLFFLTKWDFFR